MCDVQQGKVEPLSNKRVNRVFGGIVYGSLGLKWFEIFAVTFQASFHLHLQIWGAFLYTNSCASPAGPLLGYLWWCWQELTLLLPGNFS